MNNADLNGRLILEARMIMGEAKRAFDGQAWNLVVRRSQEVVELSLKGLLKLMGVESPKIHDVGETFAKICKQKNIEIEGEKLSEMQHISQQLARDRAPAFYMEREYTREQAHQALGSAETVLAEAEAMTKRLMETA
ncbi:MAG: HEPN domain-containing protein [Candidatus Poribacteria bacterium]|nr:HEPN domain-containing protein [Candidatus Poribacteria bacterium]MDE0505076.1 HEPN domain-containing protein [Candidatus Poribacteria bacterium]